MYYFLLAGRCLHCCRAFSSWAGQGPLVVLRGLLVAEQGSRRSGSVFAVHGLSCSSVCGIFRDKALTCAPCPGRRILNPWMTREVLEFLLIGGKGECTKMISTLKIGLTSNSKRFSR